MKKIGFVLSIVMFLVSGCASNKKKIDLINIEKELLSEVIFEDELVQLDEKMSKMLYEIDNATKSIVYIGSGATSEEIALFEFENQKDAKEGYEKAKQRIETQKEDYAKYIPEEVQRLENAIIKQKDNYVIVCVAKGDEAKEIINQYF